WRQRRRPTGERRRRPRLLIAEPDQPRVGVRGWAGAIVVTLLCQHAQLRRTDEPQRRRLGTVLAAVHVGIGDAIEPSVRVCVFALDPTLVSSPLDLTAMALEMRAYIETCRGALPTRDERYRVGELVRWCRDHAPDLSKPVWDIALDHERRAVDA